MAVGLGAEFQKVFDFQQVLATSMLFCINLATLPKFLYSILALQTCAQAGMAAGGAAE